MKKLDDKWFMELALAEALKARDVGEVPIGAVVVDASGEVIGRGFNRRETWQDPTAHAELLAMREAAQATHSWRLPDCTTYVTLEPCPLCAGTMVNARLGRVVYGARDPKAGAVRSLYALLEDPRLNHVVEVSEGCLADKCGTILTEFFRDIRDGRIQKPRPMPSDEEE
jgi:tRNA(adenine34) deaminase